MKYSGLVVTGNVEVNKDEFPRPGSTPAAFQKLKPCFIKDGSVTPGNSSGNSLILDGRGLPQQNCTLQLNIIHN